MMKKGIILPLAAALVLTLAGCGDGMTGEENIDAIRQETTDSGLVGIPIDGETEPVSQPGESAGELSETERQIRELEKRYGTPDFTREDYLELAALYGQNGQIKKQRDTLEICFALYRDDSAYEELQQLTVNAAEEDSSIQAQLQLLEQNLSIEEYLNEAVSMLCGEEWQQTMMPRLTAGARGYYQEQGEVSLYVRVGYDAGGAFYTQLQRQRGDQIMVMLQTRDNVQLLETSVSEGCYDGVFERWMVLADTGDVIRENGNIRDGILTGDYTAQIRWGGSADELLSLWNMREDMDMTVYDGNFGTDGITSVVQPAAEEQKVTHGSGNAGSLIVYAYDSGKQNYLFLNVEETDTAENYVFQAEAMGMPVLASYTPYEPKAETESEEEPGTIESSRLQVRVFDGNIEVYNGSRWMNMGAVDDYVAADPMAAGSEVNSDEAEEGGTGPGTDGPGITAAYANRGGGKVVPKAVATPKPTSAPAAPAATAEPTPAPTQAPAAPSNPQPQPANPAPAPTAAPTPAPTAAPTPAPTPAPTDPPITGGDSDVEWSPDIM